MHFPGLNGPPIKPLDERQYYLLAKGEEGDQGIGWNEDNEELSGGDRGTCQSKSTDGVDAIT